MCAWAYDSDWSGHPGNEMIPILLSLCNAVGDRFQAVGRTRPSWPVVSGTKSATLESADLEGLDLHRYGWFELVADGVEDLVSAPYLGAISQHRAFTTSSGTDGLASNDWSLSTLESAVGLGTLRQARHGAPLLDEIYAIRLREILNLLIYPVVYPKISGPATSPVDSFVPDSGEEAFIDAATSWSLMTTSTPQPVTGLNAEILIGNSFWWYFCYRTNSLACVADNTTTQNGAGFQGSVVSQFVPVNYDIENFDGCTVDVEGDTATIPAGTTTGAVELDGCDPIVLTGTSPLTFSWGSLTAADFVGYSGSAGDEGTDYFTGFGAVSVSPFTADPASRTAPRQVLDLSGILEDQAV